MAVSGPREPYAICQRTGQRFPVREIVREARTGLWVHRSVMDPIHPQEEPRNTTRPEEPRRTFINPDTDIAISPSLYWSDGSAWEDKFGAIWRWTA